MCWRGVYLGDLTTAGASGCGGRWLRRWLAGLEGGGSFSVRLRRKAVAGFSVMCMGNGTVTKAARRAARAAAVAAQEELQRRTRANVADLATFFSARERAEAVDGWLAERQRALSEQAAARRGEQRRQCGAALAAMRARGEALREIARLAGVTEKAVRELIREADAVPVAAGRPGVAPPAAQKAGGTAAPEAAAELQAVPVGGPAAARG